jgi:hypothetical protein
MTTITPHGKRRGATSARPRAMRSGPLAALALTVATAVALTSGSAALAYGPSPFLHRSEAQRSATVDVSRIPHTGGLTEDQIALKAERHQQAIDRAASGSPAPAVTTTSTPGHDNLPIVLSGIALLVAVGSAGLVAATGARTRRSAQPGA